MPCPPLTPTPRVSLPSNNLRATYEAHPSTVMDPRLIDLPSRDVGDGFSAKVYIHYTRQWECFLVRSRMLIFLPF